MWRFKFLSWLAHTVFKTKEGEVAPKLVQYIHRILFPLNWFYQRQSGIKYDPLRNIYTIRGMKFSGQIFEFLRHASNKGKTFQLTETDGKECMLKEIKNEMALINESQLS
jgi:hypothetical protein